jgi:hypothetical protein
MKVVIDTNVVISGLISPFGPPAQIIDLWVADEIIVCLSSKIIEEYIAVLLRPKFTRLGSAKNRYEVIAGLVELDNTIIVNPDFHLDVISEDPGDNIFLECAVEAKAEIIISRDDHLLGLAEFQGIQIIRPVNFLEKIRLR